MHGRGQVALARLRRLLASIAEAFELQADDRRVRADMVQAIASSKNATPEAFLPGLASPATV